jgi:DNA polymerase-1
MSEQKLLIDARNLLCRTYFSCSMQKDANKYEAFLTNVNYYAKNAQNAEIFLCWDTKIKSGEKNFRQTLLNDQYKAGRSSEHREALQEFQDALIPVIDSLGWCQLFPYVMESDDIIAYLCLEKFPNSKNTIVSTDQDFVQLVSENVTIYSPTKKIFVTHSNVEEYTDGISAKDYLLYKCVMGDKSDNVKGFEKHGPVKAKKVVESFSSIVLTEQQKEILEMNKKIMDLRIGYKEYPNEVKIYEKQLEKHEKENPKSLDEFRKHINRFVMDNISSNIAYWQQQYFDVKLTKSVQNDIFAKLGLV